MLCFSSNSAMDANDSTIENIEATMDCTDDEAFYGEDLPRELNCLCRADASNLMHTICFSSIRLSIFQSSISFLFESFVAF